MTEVTERLQISEQELREDISVLNVVNFGGGAYVIYAEIQGNEIEIDTEPYSDTFDRPARLLPIEANALMAAIEFLGTHLSDHLQTAHDKIKAALGEIGRDGLLVGGTGADDSDVARDVSRAIESRNLIELEYWQPAEDRFSTRTVEPYALMNGREGWYIASWDPSRDDTRSFRLDRVKQRHRARRAVRAAGDRRRDRRRRGLAADRRGRGLARRARVDLARAGPLGHARSSTVLAELPDGAVIIEWAYKGEDYLVKEVLKEAGDAAVLEPADAREAVLQGRRAPADRRRVSRRDAIKMTPEEVQAFLAEEMTLTCATNGRDGFPHLMPLWYVLREERIWAWTYAKSQKVKNLERDPRATLQVETGLDYAELRGVMLRCDVDTPPRRRRRDRLRDGARRALRRRRRRDRARRSPSRPRSASRWSSSSATASPGITGSSPGLTRLPPSWRTSRA